MSGQTTNPAVPACCPRCGGKLRLRAEQLGTEVKCPKCNATFTVGAKPPPPPARHEVVDDAYEPEVPLVRSTIAPDEPPPPPASRTRSARTAKPAKPAVTYDPAPTWREEVDAYEPEVPLAPSVIGGEGRYLESSHTIAAGTTADDLDVERPPPAAPAGSNEYLAQAARRGLIRGERDFDPPPNWTFFSGVFTFPWRGPNLLRWTAMSIGIIAALLLIPSELISEQELSIGGPFLVAMSASLLLLVGMLTAACFVSAVQDTLDGNDQVQDDGFPELNDWLVYSAGLLNVVLMSGALGVPFAMFTPAGPAAVPIAMAIFFPILMLSALESDSYLLPFSPAIWGTLVRHAGSWAMFYLLSSALVATVVLAVIWGFVNYPNTTMFLVGPALAAAMLIYARLLGRLGWKVAEVHAAMTRQMTRADDEPASPATPAKRRRKRRNRPGAADFDAAAEFLAPPRDR